VALVRTVVATVRGRDVTIVAAGLTFFAGIALVPVALLAVWCTTLLSSPGWVAAGAGRLRLLVPPEMGALALYGPFVDAALRLGPLGALVALFPASFYGEGVRRACLRLVPRADRFTGWRARIALAPLLLVLPVGVGTMIASSGLLADLALRGGLLATLGHVVVTFHVVWFFGGLALTWTFRRVAPDLPSWRATLVGAFSTSAVLSGFLHGVLVFLALPLDLGAPFGGLEVVGVVVAAGLWLLGLHVVFLLGWTATSALDRRLRGARRDDALVAQA
jgi:membrane protein